MGSRRRRRGGEGGDEGEEEEGEDVEEEENGGGEGKDGRGEGKKIGGEVGTGEEERRGGLETWARCREEKGKKRGECGGRKG
jgi:hypothetical protein